MGGTELVYNLFAECHEGESHEGLCVGLSTPIMPIVNAIAIAGLIKACLVTITFGIKVPAGIFIPTLGVGACAGRILGIAVQYVSVHCALKLKKRLIDLGIYLVFRYFERRYPDYSLFDSCRQVGDKDCVVPGLYAMVCRFNLVRVTLETYALCRLVLRLP